MSLATVSLLVAGGSSYLDDQQKAARMLANKVELPGATFLQAFEPSRHLNLLRETKVIGEINLNATEIANLGTTEKPRWIELVPIAGVSADGAPVAKSRILSSAGLSRRPMPRGLTPPVLADGTPQPMSRELFLARIPTLENAPALAVMVRSVMPEPGSFTTFDALGATQIGGGANGALVEVTGALLSQGSSLAHAARATVGAGAPGLSDGGVFLAPMLEARGGVATPLYERLFYVSACLAIFLAVLGLTPHPSWSRRKTAEPASDHVRAAGRLPSIQVFQPIRTQYEIETEASAANSDLPPGAMLRLNTLIGRAARTALWIRSPR